VRVLNDEGPASHIDPKPCAAKRWLRLFGQPPGVR
jgi:hypothetical protein